MTTTSEDITDSVSRYFTQHVLYDNLSPMEALAYTLNTDLGFKREDSRKMMNTMLKRIISYNAFQSYIQRARLKMRCKKVGERMSDTEQNMNAGHQTDEVSI